MDKPGRLWLAQKICLRLPPIISNMIRRAIYPYYLAQQDSYEYLTFSITGSPFKGNTKDFHGYPFSVHGYFEWRNIAIALALASEGDVILELGANVGTETVGFSDIVGVTGKVHAFEPLPSNIAILNHIAELSKHKNITIHSFALSDRNRISRFLIPPSHASGIGHLIGKWDQTNKPTLFVNTTTLDSLIDKIGISRIIFIDTEGEEVQILRGAELYLHKFQPTIVLEASSRALERNGFSLPDLKIALEELGYSPYRITRFGLRRIGALAADSGSVACPLNRGQQREFSCSSRPHAQWIRFQMRKLNAYKKCLS